MNNKNVANRAAPVVPAVAGAGTLTIREQARLEGVAPSTIHRRRHRAAEAKPTQAPADLATAVGALAAAQAQQSALLNRLLGGEAEVRLPKMTKEPKDDRPEKPVAGGTLEAPENREVRVQPGNYFVTVAQNNSYVHEGLLASVLQWAVRNRGTVQVARISYNASAYGQPHENVVDEDAEGQWYDPAFAEFIVRSPIRYADDLLCCVGMNISPSAVDPLSGLESYTKSSSGIFPHTKHEMRSMASVKGTPARMLYTTGACTMANYIPRKAGQKAEHHHVYGGLIVEVEADGNWFVRQVNASSDGSFQDLDVIYRPHGWEENARIENLMPGDIHRRKATEAGILDAIWAPGGMVDVLRPASQSIEDLTDFAPRNHHNLESPYFMARQRTKGQESVEDEMAECAGFLRLASRPWSEVVVVESNHDQAFGKWLENAEGHRDAPNARYWHTWNARVFEGIETGNEILPFEAAIREKAPDLERVRFLREDESYVVCSAHGGIECGLHGHRGTNGSRGTTKGYRVLGIRTNSGHTHTAGIWGGQFSAGVTGDLDMEYNKGPSSWSHSHVVTYPNGKRCIVTMRGTRWRGKTLPVAKPRIRVPTGRAVA